VQASRAGKVIHDRLFEDGKQRLARQRQRDTEPLPECTFAPQRPVGEKKRPVLAAAGQLLRGVGWQAKDLLPNHPRGAARAEELYQQGKKKVTEERLLEEVRAITLKFVDWAGLGLLTLVVWGGQQSKKPPKVIDDDEVECTFFPLTNWGRRQTLRMQSSSSR
jgi:hypothetical protein